MSEEKSLGKLQHEAAMAWARSNPTPSNFRVVEWRDLHAAQQGMSEAAAQAVAARVRAETIEACIAICKAHDPVSSRRKTGIRFADLSEEAQLEINAEERGERIASEIMEREIRALAQQDKKDNGK